MEREMARARIDSYSFFEAIPQDSDLIVQKQQQGEIVDYRECWKCRVTDCEHVLRMNRGEAAIWYTTLRLFGDMVTNDYKLCLICEDDIIFHRNFVQEVVRIFDEQARLHEIDINKPMIIGLFVNGHNFTKENITCIDDCELAGTRFHLEFTRNQSSPCYIINQSMFSLVSAGDHRLASDQVTA